ncbi:multidrug resistance protein 6 benomyl/methotrexate resistance protein [Scheffersomyces xylosifermentans]|uniref:multidrug resistance protein 6 benomyl/methotrexate resistance protein n=1 Tax=Scheffersomyces xylosifermentans TaxID=1304137 RepID=UPI00315C7AD7
MHYRFIRDSFFGRVVYHLSHHKYFSHPEESATYIVPEKYLEDNKEGNFSKEQVDVESDIENSSPSTISSKTRIEIVSPQIIVDWEDDKDPENPKNWPLYQKAFFVFQIAFLTVSVYMGAAIYTPGIDKIMEEFEVTQVVATLPLTFFVIGYGLGPMVLSPMSENAAIGRTSIYIITLFIFFILQIPTALAKDIASLTILRLIGGIFASPCLATGGASICDVLPDAYGPLGLVCWALAGFQGPSLGPLIGSILVVKAGWRWTFWFQCIVTGFCLILLTFFLPESYDKTLLYRKAKRLRAVTGNLNITSQGEIENSKLTFNELVIDTLWRPIEISVLEPVVLLIHIYISMVYAILYLWFEAFPIVFLETKHFTLIQMGVTYVSIIIGVIFGACIYTPIVIKVFTARKLNDEKVVPEVFIPMAIFGGICMPTGIFIFGWTSAEDLHWIAPLIGAAIFAVGAFFIFMTLFNYLGMSFSDYLASVFAGNDLFRSLIAGVFPLFGRALFMNLKTGRFPVAWGSSVLGFITVGMIAIPVLFYLNGPKLRARSKYASL